MAARLTKLLVLATLALAVTASGGSAASPAHRFLGVVPHVAPSAATPFALPKAFGRAAPATLTFDSSYETLINRYFTDVAHDSTGTANVYSVATQYFDNPGAVHVQYSSAVGGSYVSHDPLPANGCDDTANGGLPDQYCVTDQQLQDEIQAVLAAKGWHGDASASSLNHMFFLMTPYGVGSCFDASSAQCSNNVYCAYHNNFVDSGGEQVIYANEPYEGQSIGCTDPSTQGFPNDLDSDTTINTISHEHNEAITDPFGTGWIAIPGDGSENGDLCAYIYGSPLGGNPGTTAWNQVINTHHYSLQEEFSDADSGCLQRTGGAVSPPQVNEPLTYRNGPVMHTNTTYAIYWLPTSGNVTTPVVSGTTAAGHTLATSPGTWTAAPSVYRYQWQRCSSSGAACVNIPGATAAAYKLTAADGGRTVRSTVVANNVNGASAPAASPPTALVIGVPASTKAPHISGKAKVGKKLSGSHGKWTFSPKSYRFQWLRCNGHDGSCSSIHHATHPTYKLTKHDAKHRLRVKVTAVNAAGSKAATSKASARVPAPKH